VPAAALALVGVTSTVVPVAASDVCGEPGRDTPLASFEPWFSDTRRGAERPTATSTCR
jgi:hypothetical protein